MRSLKLLVALVAVAAIPWPVHAALAATTPSLTRGVVDINTDLGFQGGAAAGTGIVLTSNGEILTNNHVIRGATTIRVTDPSTKRSYAATVAGYDPTNDVALLTLTGATGLKTVTLGNSALVKVGDRVTAVGNAGGVGGTPIAAAGRITGLHRSVTVQDDAGNPEQLTGLLQTSAQLQPGDSGGPLLNKAGRVIGVDTAASMSLGFQQTASVGLAIPINNALTIARQIERGIAAPTVHLGPTAFLGVSISFQNGSQAVVAAVVPSAPADQAGLTTGSVITSLNGQPVTTYDSLSKILLKLTAGSKVTLAWTDADGVAHTADVVTAAGPPQ
jgi:S1-C subfamily serine protease